MIKGTLFILLLSSSSIAYSKDRVYSEKTFYGWAIFVIIVLLGVAVKQVLDDDE